MPRISRKNLSSKFIHIMVQGINKEYIFAKEKCKKKYIYLIFSNIKKYNIKTISFCIMNNHSHLLFYYNTIEEITKLMHDINTTYGKWYNDQNDRVGYVFRDRYKIEEIQDLHHLYSCINYIHNNPVKAGIVEKPSDYKYSSYNEYLYKQGIYNDDLLKILNLSKEEISEIILNQHNLNQNNYYPSDYQCIIDEFLNQNNVKSIECLSNPLLKKELITLLKKQYKINYIQIAEMLNTSRTTIYRILRSD